MLLTAHALGLGAKWSSGGITQSTEVKEWFGLSERGQVLGFIYIGYPAMISERSLRTPSANLTDSRGWDDSQSIDPSELS